MSGLLSKDFNLRAAVCGRARYPLYNKITSLKSIFAEVPGPTVGARLFTGLLADISHARRDAKIVDGHTRLGGVAGDHAAIIRPLLCGMGKAKYYLLSHQLLSGEEVGHCSVTSRVIKDKGLEKKALDAARRLADAAPIAVRGANMRLITG